MAKPVPVGLYPVGLYVAVTEVPFQLVKVFVEKLVMVVVMVEHLPEEQPTTVVTVVHFPLGQAAGGVLEGRTVGAMV